MLPSKHDAGNPRVLYAVMTASLAASAAIVAFYVTLRCHFEISIFSALLTALALAFGTVTWKYGSVLYSHAQSSLSILLALFLLLQIERQTSIEWPVMLAMGLVLGMSILIEYTNLVFVFIVSAYLVADFVRRLIGWPRQQDKPSEWLPGLIALSIGTLIPIAFLLVYNTLNFGGLLEVSTFHADVGRWPQNENLATDFNTPLLVGLQGLLLYGSNNQGLFLLSPITILGLLGLPSLYRRSRRHFILFIGTFVAFLLLFSKSTTFNPYTNDGRYLTPFLGLWFIPIAFWIDRRFCEIMSSGPPLSRVAISCLLYGLLFLSVRNIVMHIAFSWNYDLDLSQLRLMSIPPENIKAILGTVFPNTLNLPILWGLEAGVFSLAWLAARWHRKHTAVRRAEA